MERIRERKLCDVMKEKIVRLYVSFDIKKGQNVKKETYIISDPPEGFEDLDCDHYWLKNSQRDHMSVTNKWIGKIRTVLMTESLMSMECWCFEHEADEKLETIKQTIQKQIAAFIKVHEIRIEKYKKIMQEEPTLEEII